MENHSTTLLQRFIRARGEWLICLVLAALIAVVYLPMRHHGFVCYDDPLFVTQNPLIQSGLNRQSVTYAFTASVADNWHPVTTLSHILDCEFFGLSPGPMHLVNLSLHIANALMLFLVLRQMTGALWPSAVVAAIFGLHPLRVESVAWISERKNVLSFFFFMLTLWAYARYVEKEQSISNNRPSSPPSGSPSRFQPHSWSAAAWYNFSLLFFALGLMSKPVLVSLPLLLLLLDYWPLHRVELNGPGVSQKLARLVLEKWRFFALSAACCWITLLFEHKGGGIAGLKEMSLSERAANAVTSYLMYVWQLFWPTRLAVLYPHPARHYPVTDSWPLWQVWTAALLLLAVSVLCLCQLRRRPFLAVGWFWYLGALVPVIGLVQVGEQAMADRHTYIPLIGFTISLVWFISEFGNARAWQRVVLGTLTVAALLGCILLTCRQVGFWRSSVALFERAVEVTADNPVAQCNLGFGLVTEGKPALGAVRYRVALAINPKYAQAHLNLGGLLKDGHYWPQAAKEYEAVLSSEPDMFLAHVALVKILPHTGRTKEAIAHLEAALHVCSAPLAANTVPGELMAEAMNDLAWELATSPEAGLRDGNNSVRFAEQACALTEYKQATLVRTLAAAYAEADRFSEAITTVEMASALAHQAGDQALLRQNQQLLELFRAGRSFHQQTE